MLKRWIKVLAVVTLVAMLMTACGGEKPQEEAANGMTAGTYEEKVEGYNGEFIVTTTIDEDGKISKVEVGENEETDGIGSNAIEKLPLEIVEKQSLAVDTITGATVTSTAILTAVENAIVKAGGDVEEWKTPVENETTGEVEELEADVVVIGGGGAGLSAAVSAAQNDAKVILIEKTAALGGNTIRAGGPYNAVDPDRQANVKLPSAMKRSSLLKRHK